jgi:hypothetical protein
MLRRESVGVEQKPRPRTSRSATILPIRSLCHFTFSQKGRAWACCECTKHGSKPRASRPRCGGSIQHATCTFAGAASAGLPYQSSGNSMLSIPGRVSDELPPRTTVFFFSQSPPLFPKLLKNETFQKIHRARDEIRETSHESASRRRPDTRASRSGRGSGPGEKSHSPETSLRAGAAGARGRAVVRTSHSTSASVSVEPVHISGEVWRPDGGCGAATKGERSWGCAARCCVGGAGVGLSGRAVNACASWLSRLSLRLISLR